MIAEPTQAPTTTTPLPITHSLYMALVILQKVYKTSQKPVILTIAANFVYIANASGYNQTSENYSAFNISNWHFSKYEMCNLGWFSKIQSHIQPFMLTNSW